MSVEISSTELFEGASSYLEWALETGLWNGRLISRLAAFDLFEKIQAKILTLVSKELSVFPSLSALSRTITSVVSIHHAEKSFAFSTLGKRDPRLAFFGGNGINIKLQEAQEHALHLSKFTQGYSVDWIYNKSHGLVMDLLEVVLCNLFGYSPNTTELHLQSWTQFHEANKENPLAKCMQFGHSQDVIHIRNALEKAPREIRNRVIVVAFGSPVTIPDDLCFQALHFACKGDLIPYSEPVYHGVMRGTLGWNASFKPNKTIWMEPHPDTQNPHDFQNPAFDLAKGNIIADYLSRNGEYESIVSMC